MPDCKVYGDSPGEGPGMLAARTARDSVNSDHAGWNVTIRSRDDDETIFTSTTAPRDQMEDAFKEEFTGYNVMAY